MEIIEIPAQSGAVTRMRAGQELRIIDVEGTQVADLFAVCADDREEWLSASHTRGRNWRLFPEVGGVFVTSSYRPLLTFVEDGSPGFHDAQFSACDSLMYQALGHVGYHPSCADNFRIAADSIGWHPTHVPDPINIFQRTPVGPEGSLSTLPAATKPGDYVVLRAETDIDVIVTACSMDLKDINGGHCTPIRLEVS